MSTNGSARESHLWTFLSNHGHVLICIANDSDVRLREVANQVGITERAVQRIVTELEDGGFITRVREGRRNHYEVHRETPLRHPLETHHTVGELVDVLRRGDER